MNGRVTRRPFRQIDSQLSLIGARLPLRHQFAARDVSCQDRRPTCVFPIPKRGLWS